MASANNIKTKTATITPIWSNRGSVRTPNQLLASTPVCPDASTLSARHGSWILAPSFPHSHQLLLWVAHRKYAGIEQNPPKSPSLLGGHLGGLWPFT